MQYLLERFGTQRQLDAIQCNVPRLWWQVTKRPVAGILSWEGRFIP